jgi:pimeloyl-ACP methyl ester carboxylesterase
MLRRLKLRAGPIVYELWYRAAEDLSAGKPVLVCCHGCPSHPYDHTPARFESYADKYLLAFLHYEGTWESDGVCTLQNAVDSVLQVANHLRSGEGNDLRSGESIRWSIGEVFLIGASFGGSVVLVSAAKDPLIKRVVAIAPVVSFEDHDDGSFEEEDLALTWKAISNAWRHLWRVDKEHWDRMVSGAADLNPVQYTNVLMEKNVLIVHGTADNSIAYQRSAAFIDHIGGNLHLVEGASHLGLYALEDVRDIVQDFLSKD